MFKRMIIHTNGFTNTLKHRTGLEIIFVENHYRFHSEDCYVMFPIRWRHQPNLIAEFVRRNLVHQGRLDVVCFSYGGGVWYPKFERLMDRAGRRIHTACLIDPVPRLGRLHPGRLLGNYKVRVHDADNCVVFRQYIDHPRSPGVVFGNGVNHDEIIVGSSSVGRKIGHADIDNSLITHKRIFQALEAP